MSLATYADLQTAATSWSHRADLASILPDLITVAETKIFRELRSREMETTLNATMAADGTLALPSSYIELKEAYLNASPIQFLERKSARFIRERYKNTGVVNTPRFIAREGSSFIFGPYPDSTYLVTGIYYKNIGPLSASAHAVFTTNPDLYLFGTLLEIAPYLKNDPRIPVWQSKYDQAMREAQALSDREEYSGSDLRVTPA